MPSNGDSTNRVGQYVFHRRVGALFRFIFLFFLEGKKRKERKQIRQQLSNLKMVVIFLRKVGQKETVFK